MVEEYYDYNEMEEYYICEGCDKVYNTWTDAEQCEDRHEKSGDW